MAACKECKRESDTSLCDACDRLIDEIYTARAEAAALRSEVARLTAERDRLAEREALFIKALSPVCDAGQYRADIVSAIRRVTAERDALRAEVEAMREVEEAARNVVVDVVHGRALFHALGALDALRARKVGG